MRYLCLVCSEEERLTVMPKSELDDTLRQSGHFLIAAALQSVHTATTVRVRNGKTSLTDGPFAETKEQVGGFYLIESRDLNEALQIAAKIPSARHGCIEVRPVWEIVPPTVGGVAPAA